MRAVAVAALLVITGCGGAVGPQGPQGPQGPAGPPGAANVQATTFSFDGRDLNVDPEGNASYQVSIPSLTRGVVENGVVQAYIDDGGTGWTALPLTLTDYIDDGDDTYLATLEISYQYDVESFRLLFTDSASGYPYDSLSGIIKVVVIPPSSALAARDRGKRPGGTVLSKLPPSE